MAIKIKKTGFVKAFTKTKLGYHLDKEIGKGDFEWEYKYEPKRDDNAWHPSGHCTPSLAELYHYAKDSQELAVVANPDDGAPIEKNATQSENFTPALYKTFQVGHFWHQYCQELCARMDFCDSESIERRGTRAWTADDPRTVTFSGELEGFTPEPYHWTTGSADIAPCNVPGHGEYLIDFKTMGSHVFRPNLPSDDTLVKWECQLNVYMDFFNLEKALIVGINKDSPHDFKEFEFHRNEELVERLYYKWKLVSTCLDEDEEPPHDEVVDLPTKGPVNV